MTYLPGLHSSAPTWAPGWGCICPTHWACCRHSSSWLEPCNRWISGNQGEDCRADPPELCVCVCAWRHEWKHKEERLILSYCHNITHTPTHLSPRSHQHTPRSSAHRHRLEHACWHPFAWWGSLMKHHKRAWYPPQRGCRDIPHLHKQTYWTTWGVQTEKLSTWNLMADFEEKRQTWKDAEIGLENDLWVEHTI